MVYLILISWLKSFNFITALFSNSRASVLLEAFCSAVLYLTTASVKGLKAPATVSASYTLSLPTADSANSGYGLTTDGAGQLSFTDVASTGKAIAMALVFG